MKKTKETKKDKLDKNIQRTNEWTKERNTWRKDKL